MLLLPRFSTPAGRGTTATSALAACLAAQLAASVEAVPLANVPPHGAHARRAADTSVDASASTSRSRLHLTHAHTRQARESTATSRSAPPSTSDASGPMSASAPMSSTRTMSRAAAARPTTAKLADTNNQNHHSQAGLIAGVVIGVIGGILVLVLVGLVLWRWRRNRRSAHSATPPTTTERPIWVDDGPLPTAGAAAGMRPLMTTVSRGTQSRFNPSHRTSMSSLYRPVSMTSKGEDSSIYEAYTTPSAPTYSLDTPHAAVSVSNIRQHDVTAPSVTHGASGWQIHAHDMADEAPTAS